ncbi:MULTISPECIES: Arc family DNA-binding protein [unclassified Acinetobacter]|uniref:Arc family DNA-binding protein n=1 Tax=unclassified Acinetobacter TaxID=196816 RepID=UPI00244CCE7E|nr:MULTISPECIES: Arc family DNA-binding protein [unclassified Acinetobacter]MDH0032087.1 Arc family DNA-binding protein [Acinetobacter sp. GD04021]MDH0887743.1 Arc family DNA-binding protein [Acinetobacter sp. GD03873]MDH1084091.1 Arc family DNA-binding protein [Acinetobacter sp. GD03983]MDH2190982.1 Arc family DNA-binding protein [Acinetobacter sp. GD03645]MDH2204603.1 Arc family DNA-binding protein [Acinetobacter sp. GD03647]
MSREDPQLKVRLPQELKDKITESASNLGRSINADVVARLEESFSRASLKDTSPGELMSALANSLALDGLGFMIVKRDDLLKSQNGLELLMSNTDENP